MLLGLKTFRYLPWFMAGRMDVFGFIRRTREGEPFQPWRDRVAHVRELDRHCRLDASAARRQRQNLEERTGS